MSLTVLLIGWPWIVSHQEALWESLAYEFYLTHPYSLFVLLGRKLVNNLELTKTFH